MADMMTFPDKFMDFIKQYSFKDKEEMYTNGSDLIPVFRVEQAWEHYVDNISVAITNIDSCLDMIRNNLYDIEGII